MKPEVQEFEVTLRWGKLRGLERAGKGRTVIAVHGWLDTASSFEPLMRELNKDFRIIALDLAGHGRSDHRPPNVRYELVDYALDILDLMDAMHLSECELLGHSLGGAVAMVCAAVDPKRFRTIALIDSLGPLPRSQRTLPQALAQYRSAYRALLSKKAPIYATLEEVGEARARVSDLDPKLAVKLLERSLRKVAGGYSWLSDPRLRLPLARPFFESEVTECLQAVTCPVLLVKADPGLFRDNYPLEERLKNLRHVEPQTLKGGHHAHLEHPNAMAQRYEAFLNRQTNSQEVA